jgi:hypothetical protein
MYDDLAAKLAIVYLYKKDSEDVDSLAILRVSIDKFIEDEIAADRGYCQISIYDCHIPDSGILLRGRNLLITKRLRGDKWVTVQ